MFLQLTLLASAGIMAYAAYITFAFVDFAKRITVGEPAFAVEQFYNAYTIEDQAALLNSSVNGMLYLCAIAYLIFVSNAAGSLRDARAVGFKRSPGGAILLSIIPVANIVLAFLVMRDIWSSSRKPRGGTEDLSGALVMWWVLFLAGMVLARVADYNIGEALDVNNFDRAVGGAWLSAVACAAVIVSCALLALLARQIVRAQAAWRNLPESPATESTARAGDAPTPA